MSKRPASYDIDERTFEEKERSNGGAGQIDPEGAHMAGRKIFKIARHHEQPQQTRSDKVDLKIEGLGTQKPAEEGKPQGKDEKAPENPFKFDLFAQSQGIGLFTNIFTTPAAAPTKDQEKIPAKQPAPTLSVPSLPLRTQIDSKSSLFSKPAPQTTGSLFSQPNPSSILFGGTTLAQFTSGNLFKDVKLQGPLSSPPVDKPEEDEGDSQELEKEQEMVADPSKSTKHFDYGEQTILQKLLVNKYKKDKGDLVENVEVILNHDSGKKIHELVARLPATKNIIFRGLLLPHKSAATKKGDNIDVLTFALNSAKTLQPHRIKLQAKGSESQKDQFFESLSAIISGESSPSS